MKDKSIYVLCWSMVVGGLLILAALVLLYPDAPFQPPRTPLLVKECVAVVINVETGEQTETPTPCLAPSDTGCTGSITVTVSPDGIVTSTCVPGSGNPSEQS